MILKWVTCEEKGYIKSVFMDSTLYIIVTSLKEKALRKTGGHYEYRIFI